MLNGQFEVVQSLETEKKPRKRGLRKSRAEPKSPPPPVPSTSRDGTSNEAYENDFQSVQNGEERTFATKLRTASLKLNADQKKIKALLHLITVSRNWGQMSPMQLAVQVNYEKVISHPMCTKIIDKVWRKRETVQEVIT
jgi:hypothetical protein